MMIPDNYCIEVACKKRLPDGSAFHEHVCTVELPLARSREDALETFRTFAKRLPEYELRLMRVTCRSGQIGYYAGSEACAGA